MIWFLDTNICVDYLRGRTTLLLEAFKMFPPQSVRLPSVVVAELLYGAQKSSRPKQNLLQVRQFIAHFDVVVFDEQTAEHYADIRTALDRAGTPIGPNDLLIAAIVRSAGGTLVTANIREFKRVKGLKLETWAEIAL
jgi:tRNA(fMet)-specific endonuclease VapC